MFDFILSNPPYIPTEDIETLQTEVHDEPQNALDGGDDGLDFYREIIKQGAKHLNKNGEMIFEFGINQEKELNELASKYFRQVEFFKDYAGIERVMLGCI